MNLYNPEHVQVVLLAFIAGLLLAAFVYQAMKDILG